MPKNGPKIGNNARKLSKKGQQFYSSTSSDFNGTRAIIKCLKICDQKLSNLFCKIRKK